MLNSFLRIRRTKHTIVKRKVHVFPPQNVTGAQPVISEQPEEDLVLMLARGFPNPFIDWV